MSTWKAGLLSRCPRCGRGQLFSGYLRLAERCPTCDLDYGFADPADGPAFFVMSAIGIAVTMLWAWWVVAAQPPLWLQALVVFPALLIGCLGALRPVKAWLVAEQYHRQAGEGAWLSHGGHGEGGFTSRRRR